MHQVFNLWLFIFHLLVPFFKSVWLLCFPLSLLIFPSFYFISLSILNILFFISGMIVPNSKDFVHGFLFVLFCLLYTFPAGSYSYCLVSLHALCIFYYARFNCFGALSMEIIWSLIQFKITSNSQLGPLYTSEVSQSSYVALI